MLPKKSAANIALGKTVRSLREAQGHTQESFAAKVRMNSRYMGGIERGEVNSSVDTLHKVIKGLGVSFADLFGEAGL
jgi:transcriptional regulator with XRE-family HTH domain